MTWKQRWLAWRLKAALLWRFVAEVVSAPFLLFKDWLRR